VSRERSDIVYIDKRKKRENKEGEKEDEVPLSLVQMQVNTVNWDEGNTQVGKECKGGRENTCFIYPNGNPWLNIVEDTTVDTCRLPYLGTSYLMVLIITTFLYRSRVTKEFEFPT
jgi:hypothetical protein